MAERYMRYPVTVAAATETTIFTAPNDGEGINCYINRLL